MASARDYSTGFFFAATRIYSPQTATPPRLRVGQRHSFALAEFIARLDDVGQCVIKAGSLLPFPDIRLGQPSGRDSLPGLQPSF